MDESRDNAALPERLRRLAKLLTSIRPELLDAADEIDRLRGEVDELRGMKP